MKNPLHLASRRLAAAFSLIEMLVVVSIIVILMAFSTPALMRTLQSSRLSAVGDGLMGAISEAQQTAYAQNVPVEIRFFNFPEPGFPSSPKLFRAYQVFKIVLATEGTGAAATVKESVVPVNNLVQLSDGCVIARDNGLSKMLNGTLLPDTKENATNGYSGVEGATYIALRFMTDGSCRSVSAAENGFAQLAYGTLPESYFTITYDISQEITADNLPKNFYTIQVDPFTGKALRYRPGF